MQDDPLRILIVEARSEPRLADGLLAGARAALAAVRTDVDVFSVPGPLEIPAVIAIAEESGHRPTGVRYDGYVALGCVIRGETLHYGVAAGEAARALMDLAIGRRMAIGNGVIAVETRADAEAMTSAGEASLGAAAARACLAVLEVKHRLLGRVR
ncbi:MAG TPA: 6,7-dimethyl-8-ribityllumazine synthase [Caulobacteraceae bacterium]|jgi:6,7-dimethyl-8-ribityllumazine synthase